LGEPSVNFVVEKVKRMIAKSDFAIGKNNGTITPPFKMGV